jgi:CheY-like chemotaxis protein
VLVADDDAVHREVISDLLERAGHAVVAVASGPAAVEASQRGRFDVVLLDLQIPEMGGFETAVAIRRLEPPGFRTSIVALTASDAPGYGDRCRDAGIDASLSKPVSRDNLVAVVEGSPRLP